MNFPFYKQQEIMDCGPTCLRMVLDYHGKKISIEKLRQLSKVNTLGTNLKGLTECANSLGVETETIKIKIEDLIGNVETPFILFWTEGHYVVVYKIDNQKVTFADPSVGLLTTDLKDIKSRAETLEEEKVIVLLLSPTDTFFETLEEEKSKLGFGNFIKLFFINKRLIFQLVLTLIAANIIQLAVPFLTKSIIDVGVKNSDITFVYIILASQLMLMAGRTLVEFVRSWVIQRIGTTVNLSMLSDYVHKILSLPIPFFENRKVGDIMQRMEDFNRVEHFLTNQTLGVIFSFFNLVILSSIIINYNIYVYLIFILGSFIYCLWIVQFNKVRRNLDYRTFTNSSSGTSNFIQLIQGIKDLKLANAVLQTQWDWEKIQVEKAKLNMHGMRISQTQQFGSFIINETKNILIIFLCAKSVISGDMTLGSMLAIQQILGQLSVPIEQFLGFSQSFQDAKISLERLNEIHKIESENDSVDGKDISKNDDIVFRNVFYSYSGSMDDNVLKNISLRIPKNKKTAIVGLSGSGKTTLLKLLLGFYETTSGSITFGENDLKEISKGKWRAKFGSVMQDGYIFSSTIAKNIALGEENLDIENIKKAAQIANISDFIEMLPNKYETMVGEEGYGLSQGQKQRILIARAIFKNPQIIIFDEATNSLDAENESIVQKNLDQYFETKTSITVAHRLSTIINADQIIVLEKGEIIEAGTHSELKRNKGRYFQLLKNQFENIDENEEK